MSFGSDPAGVEGFRDPLRVLRSGLDELLDQDPADLVDAELGSDLLRWSRQRDRADAGFAAWVLAAVRRGIGIEDGYVDTIGWLAWKSGKSRAELRRVVRLAELCELLPETGAAWRDGTITSTAVELIANARVVGCDDELAAMEAEFLAVARRGDHKSLKTLTQHFKECARADGSKPAPPDEFTVAFVGDRCVGRFDVTTTTGQTIVDVLEQFTRPPAANDGTSLAVRQDEGFVRMCEVALARGTGADGARPVVGYLTHARTPDDVTRPLTLGLFCGVIDPRERDRILCDATIVPIETDADGNPLSVGRATRVWPAAIRRAIVARDRHCRWPGCEIPAAWCDVHHAVSWEDGGATSSTNGHLFCRRHHTFRHAHADWTFTFERQQLNPRGVWHTADVHDPGEGLFITPGLGTEHRAR